MRFFRDNSSNERGASMVEYALLVALIAMMSLSAVTLLGNSTEETFNTVAAELERQPADEAPSNESPDDQSQDDQSQDDQSPDDQSQDDQSQDDQSQDDQSQDDQSQDDQSQDDQSQDDQSQDDQSQDDQSQDDSANEQQGENGDEVNGDSGGSDQSDDTEGEDPVMPGSNPTANASDLYWWNDTKHGGNGAWTASVTYGNDTDRHQYLDLEITRVDEKGKETTSRYNNFYVPANGTSTYTEWTNQIHLHKGDVSGTVQVKVKVISIKTSDENWQTYSYDVDEKPVSVDAPDVK